MIRYTFFFRTAGAVSVVTDRPLILDDESKWIKARQYKPNTGRYGRSTYLKDVYINKKEIAYIQCEGEIKSTEEKEDADRP